MPGCTPQIEIYKKTDSVHIMILNVLRDLRFGRKQLPKSADDQWAPH
jgi:hypothetical protein